jgi:hypothetical protein
MGSGNGKAGAAMEEGELPADLLALIRDGVEVGRRSEQFHHAVGWLKQLGWTVAGIISLFEKYPEGIAENTLRASRRRSSAHSASSPIPLQRS